MRVIQIAAALGFMVACAGSQKLPPGNALEFDEQDPQRTLAQSKDTPEDVALAKAFDTPDEQSAPTAAPPTAVPSPLSAPDTSDAVAADQTAWNNDLATMKQALAAQRWDEVMAPDQEILNRAERLGPPQQRTVAELMFRAAAGKPDRTSAMAAAKRWLNACGPQGVDGCRQRVVAALEKLGKSKLPGAAQAKRQALQLREDDLCLVAAERKNAPAPCLERAIGHYKRQEDGLMVARAHLLKARALAAQQPKGGAALPLLELVQRDCEGPRCILVRRAAYRLASTVAVHNDDLETAAKALMAEARLEASTLPPAKRPYHRPQAVEAMCARLDAQVSSGTCRKIEKEHFGDLTFRDFSQLKAKEGLSSGWVTQVSNHFKFGIESCLSVEAKRLRPPASETYAVRWTVLNDGRVADVHMGRKEQDNGALASCLRQQFGWWRYPRYEGEFQHVEQSFTVTAQERRP